MKRSKKSETTLFRSEYLWDPVTKTAVQEVRFERADGTHTKTRAIELTESYIIDEIDTLSTLLVALRTGIDPAPGTDTDA